jgi:hypothetical protein
LQHKHKDSSDLHNPQGQSAGIDLALDDTSVLCSNIIVIVNHYILGEKQTNTECYNYISISAKLMN